MTTAQRSPADDRESDLTLEWPGHAPLAARLYGRRVAAGGPLVLHFHGGNFTGGGLENGALVARELARSNAVVLSLAYPVGDAHPFPDAVDAGYVALEWAWRHRVKLAGKAARLYLAGEEAGGNVAAGVALMARDRSHPPLAGQILLSPMLDPCSGTSSLRQVVRDATTCRWAEGWSTYLRSPGDTTHPYAVPGASLRLAGLPPTLVLVSRGDPMHDEGLAYACRLAQAGICVQSAELCPAECWPAALYEPASPEPVSYTHLTLPTKA